MQAARANKSKQKRNMKNQSKFILAALMLSSSAWLATAQPPDGPPPDGAPPGGPGRPGHHHPPLPIVAVLDTNHDGIIDSNEIAQASLSLKKLDKNGDGQLTPDEYLPPHPGGPGGPPPGEGPGAGSGAQTNRPPVPPIVAALDLNGDGIIDANEIAQAPQSLKKLDKNGDGQLTPDEYRPPHPGGPPPGQGSDQQAASGAGQDDAGGPPPDDGQGPPMDDGQEPPPPPGE